MPASSPPGQVRQANTRPTKTIALAAGRGCCLASGKDDCPKPLLAMAGRPLLSSALTSLHCAGVREVYLVLNHLAGQIIHYVGTGAGGDLAVAYAGQPRLSKTAYGFEAAKAFCDRRYFAPATDYCLPKDYLNRLPQHYDHYGADSAAALKALSNRR